LSLFRNIASDRGYVNFAAERLGAPAMWMEPTSSTVGSIWLTTYLTHTGSSPKAYSSWPPRRGYHVQRRRSHPGHYQLSERQGEL